MLKKIFLIFVFIFATVGFFLTAGFFAVKFHLTDALGKVDLNDRYFAAANIKLVDWRLGKSNSADYDSAKNHCRALILAKFEPKIGANILSSYAKTKSDEDLYKMLLAQEIYLKDNQAYQEKIKVCDVFEQVGGQTGASTSTPANKYSAWIESEEWQTIKAAVVKDQGVINEVGAKTGVSPRMIVAMLVGEQLRLFNSEREVFKQFFQPLKILGNEVKFSWGVTGVKEETARLIEKNLKDKTSPYYPGAEYENLLDFKTASIDEERYARLTDEKNRYYPYLYTALFIKEIDRQWKGAGFEIGDRPEIMATLYNLGFVKSAPNANPQVGGSSFTVGGTEYTFGAIAYQFYYSGELFDEFPLE